MTTKELLALVDTLRARATEHGDLHRKQTGYGISFEDAGKESAYDNAADELAPIATALCAEVEAQNEHIAQQDATIARLEKELKDARSGDFFYHY